MGIRDLEKPTGISGNTLKIIAVVSMCLDHIGASVIANGILLSYNETKLEYALSTEAGQRWLQIYEVLRVLGRLAFPIFCFLLAEGFLHTKSLKKYRNHMLVFALISEIPFDLAVFHTWFYPGAQNVYFTFFIGLLVLTVLEKFEGNGTYQAFAVFAGCGAAVLLRTDYSAEGVLFISTVYLLRQKPRLQAGVFGALAALGSSAQYFAGALALIPVRLYNGERGRLKIKYFFYWFYPVHLLLCFLLVVILNRTGMGSSGIFSGGS